MCLKYYTDMQVPYSDTYLDSGCGDGDGGGDAVWEAAVALVRRLRRHPRALRSAEICAAAPAVCSRSASPGSGRSGSEV